MALCTSFILDEVIVVTIGKYYPDKDDVMHVPLGSVGSIGRITDRHLCVDLEDIHRSDGKRLRVKVQPDQLERIGVGCTVHALIRNFLQQPNLNPNLPTRGLGIFYYNSMLVTDWKPPDARDPVFQRYTRNRDTVLHAGNGALVINNVDARNIKDSFNNECLRSGCQQYVNEVHNVGMVLCESPKSLACIDAHTTAAFWFEILQAFLNEFKHDPITCLLVVRQGIENNLFETRICNDLTLPNRDRISCFYSIDRFGNPPKFNMHYHPVQSGHSACGQVEPAYVFAPSGWCLYKIVPEVKVPNEFQFSAPFFIPDMVWRLTVYKKKLWQLASNTFESTIAINDYMKRKLESHGLGVGQVH